MHRARNESEKIQTSCESNDSESDGEVKRTTFSTQTTWETAPPSADEVLHFKYTDKKYRKLFRWEKDVSTVDLHGLSAEEARELTLFFLGVHITQGSLGTGGQFTPGSLAIGRMLPKLIKIVTGRGVHSEGGVPIIKPVVKNILIERKLQYNVTDKGGAFTVQL